MRIFNGTNSLLTLPLNGGQKLEIHPKSVSSEFMGSNDFLSMIVSCLSNEEIAIIVSGPYELNVCANVPTAVNYVVQTLDEAIIRLGLKKEQPTKCECHECGCKEEETKTDTPIEPKPVENPDPETIEEGEIKNEETTTEETNPVEVEEKPKRTRKKASNK